MIIYNMMKLKNNPELTFCEKIKFFFAKKRMFSYGEFVIIYKRESDTLFIIDIIEKPVYYQRYIHALRYRAYAAHIGAKAVILKKFME